MTNEDGNTTLRIKLDSLTAAAEPRKPALVVLTGGQMGELFKIDGPEVTVGRGVQCAIRLEDASVSRQHLRIEERAGQHYAIDLESANGTFVNGEPLHAPVLLQDGDKIGLGRMIILRYTYQDEYDEAFQRQLYNAALRDGLTRAYNKRYLLERIKVELAFAKRHHEPLAICMIDADHFKRVNDVYSHPAGDKILIEIVRTIQGTIRQEDIIGRYGGEEFLLICRGIDAERCYVVANRIRMLIEKQLFSFNHQIIPVTVSIGVAAFPDAGIDSTEDLIAAADTALYQAKAQGRNRVNCYQPPDAP